MCTGGAHIGPSWCKSRRITIPLGYEAIPQAGQHAGCLRHKSCTAIRPSRIVNTSHPFDSTFSASWARRRKHHCVTWSPAITCLTSQSSRHCSEPFRSSCRPPGRRGYYAGPSATTVTAHRLFGPDCRPLVGQAQNHRPIATWPMPAVRALRRCRWQPCVISAIFPPCNH